MPQLTLKLNRNFFFWLFIGVLCSGLSLEARGDAANGDKKLSNTKVEAIAKTYPDEHDDVYVPCPEQCTPPE